jgi:hypothetical protein
MSAGVRSGITARYHERQAQRVLIQPYGHVGTARWHRPLVARIRRLFPYLRRVASISVQPREFHVSKHNPMAPAIKASITAAVLLVAIQFWRRRGRRSSD